MDFPYQFSRLPQEVRQKVLDYLEFLLSRYSQQKLEKGVDLYSLRGTVLSYQDPFLPVAQDDWEILS